MDISPAAISICDDFVDEAGIRYSVSATIALIKTITGKTNAATNEVITHYISGCSMFKNCKNQDCQYAINAGEKKK